MADFDPASVKLDLAAVPRWNALTLPYLVERDGLDLDKPALVVEDRARTYGQLRDQVRRIAFGLTGLGIEPMDRVAVLSENRLEWMELEIGIAAARGIMVPLNWRLHPNELRTLLQRSNAKAIVCEPRFIEAITDLRRAGELPDLRTIVRVGDGDGGDLSFDDLCASDPPSWPLREGSLDDPHEIIFTSGTTGDPKGVVWSNGTVLFNALQQLIDYRIGSEDASYTVIDQYYIGGRHNFVWAMLHRGATAHIKTSGGFDARAVVEYVAEQRITHVLWVTTMVREILRVPDLVSFDTSCLKMIMSGGQPVSREITERTQAAFPTTDFIQVYGLTEGGGSVTYIRPEDARRKAGSAGKASTHARIKVVDPDGNEAAIGSDGEILVKAPSVAAGYWDAPELTREGIRDGWLHTGDLGRFDDEGYLTISGRKKDMIISGGMNVFPSEVEDVLSLHESVAEVAVIGLPDEKWGETVCAVVVPRDGAPIDARELIDFCREHLAGFKKPTSVRVVDELPKTGVGKVQKFLLRERFAPEEQPV